MSPKKKVSRARAAVRFPASEADAATSREIERELREGTPNTPQRVATIQRGVAIYQAHVDDMFWLRVVNELTDVGTPERSALHSTRLSGGNMPVAIRAMLAPPSGDPALSNSDASKGVQGMSETGIPEGGA